MWIFGMMTIVMGMAPQEAGWDWKYLSYGIFEQMSFDIILIDNRVYLAWIIVLATFVFLDMIPTKTFVM